MPNPFVLAAVAGTVRITCPHCGHRKLVVRRPASRRTCRSCGKHFVDPVGRTAAR